MTLIIDPAKQGLSTALQFVWDPVLLDAVVATQAAGGGGGGGGAVTVADGADVAEGATTALESTTGAGTVIGLLKRLRHAIYDTNQVDPAPTGIQGMWLNFADGRHLPIGDQFPLPVQQPGGQFISGGNIETTSLDSLSAVIDPATKQQLPTALTVAGNLKVSIQEDGGAVIGVDDNGGSLTVDDGAGSLTMDSPQLPATLGQKLLAASLAVAIASDQGPLVLTGSKSNNLAAPGATNLGALIALANEGIPALYTEGNLVFMSTDLRGVVRVIDTAEDCLGEAEWQGITGTYTGLLANTPLCSLRWGDATRFCKILRVEILVFTSTSATAAGITERQLVIARSFTVSDTGGVAAVLTGNNQKLRTSDAASLVTDLRIGNPLTAGTRVLDAAPIASAAGWSGLLSTGVVIGASGSSAVGAARSTEGGGQMATLFDAEKQGTRKLVLAQNEGIVIRIGAAQPAGAVQQTMVKIKYRVTNKPN